MAKKTKSKQRLDQYYHYARTQGYRSRAAYKLIQLNRKYNFLNNATTVIDLCAAPGGWMQVCSNTMPPNSTIIGVDLDQIKKVPGAKSFKGDITKQQTYDRLRRQLKGRKCDAVLNDGAPNVGANWSKDAYSQSELVLASFKLSCDFLKEGGYFITKVFRSTDTQSLMWAFKKFFDKVQMSKPKASRFTSAQTFIVGVGYNSPTFIDEKYFDPKYIFKDTQADHFHEQIAGQMTSIDKLLQNRRKRGGYEDNAPMHLYKQVPLTRFIQQKNPIVMFAEYNRITVSKQERQKYYNIWNKMPQDIDELLADLRVLGKRQLGQIMKWRSKIRQYEHKNKIKAQKIQQEEQASQLQEDGDQEYEDDQQQMQQEGEQEENEQQIEQQILKKQKKQIREHRRKQQKKSELLVRAQLANKQHNEDDIQLGQQHFDSLIGDQDLNQIGFEQNVEEQKTQKLPKYIKLNNKQMEENLQEMYEIRKKRREDKLQQAREIRRRKKQRRQQRFTHSQKKLKSRRFGPDDRLSDQSQKQNQQQDNQQQEAQEEDFQEFKFKNPLAGMDDQDIYISENQQQAHNYDGPVDPNEKMAGEDSDQDAYVIPKPQTQMQKRRKKIKKNQDKKKKKLHKDIEDGQDVGTQIEIVKQKTMDDYNIDSLAETLVIAKKMLRNSTRQEIIDASYRGITFEDHQQLPKWFTEDQQKHNFKSLPITKQQYNREKQKIQAINARIPKKIMQAKVRRKIRIQKKLKKTQKKAEMLMSQQGINEVNKLRQIGKMYDKSKRQLKDQKKYVIGKKGKTVGGKDSRKVKHVDRRLKKDKAKTKTIKKTRQVKRHKRKRGKF